MWTLATEAAMLKPFFTNPFKSLATRTGTPIGDAGERTMLAALGGSDGFRKRFQLNADGSTTMLKTKNGMPRFITDPVATAGGIVITNSSVADIGVDPTIVHTVTLTDPFSLTQTLTFVDGTAIAGVTYDWALTDSNFNNGVSISGMTLTIPPGVFVFQVSVHCFANEANSAGISLTYTLHIGASTGGLGTFYPI